MTDQVPEQLQNNKSTDHLLKVVDLPLTHPTKKVSIKIFCNNNSFKIIFFILSKIN